MAQDRFLRSRKSQDQPGGWIRGRLRFKPPREILDRSKPAPLLYYVQRTQALVRNLKQFVSTNVISASWE